VRSICRTDSSLSFLRLRGCAIVIKGLGSQLPINTLLRNWEIALQNRPKASYREEDLSGLGTTAQSNHVGLSVGSALPYDPDGYLQSLCNFLQSDSQTECPVSVTS
jgi:hypothetical protein